MAVLHLAASCTWSPQGESARAEVFVWGVCLLLERLSVAYRLQDCGGNMLAVLCLCHNKLRMFTMFVQG